MSVERLYRVEEGAEWPRDRHPQREHGARMRLVLAFPRILHCVDSSPKAGRKVKRRKWHLWGAVSISDDLSALDELHVEAVDGIALEAEPLSFTATYRTAGSRERLVAVQYRADTPTDCALIVAHVQYLRELLSRRI